MKSSTHPGVIFSYSDRDAEAIKLLQKLFVEKCGGQVDVHLSANGQGLPINKNWIVSVENALDKAKLLFIFLTPNTQASAEWLLFEAGYAHARNIQVVLVGYLGFDVTNLPAPLSMLKGFNVQSHQGLNNLLELTDREFNLHSMTRFSSEDFQQVAVPYQMYQENALLGDMVPWVNKLKINAYSTQDFEAARIVKGEANKGYYEKTLEMLHHTVTHEGITCQKDHGTLRFSGCQIKGDDAGRRLVARLEPGSLNTTLPVLNKIMTILSNSRYCNIFLELYFNSSVKLSTSDYIVSGKLIGTPIHPASAGWMQCNQTLFRFQKRSYTNKEPSIRKLMEVVLNQADLPVQDIRSILTICRNRHIIEER